jgi:hypothetical protein
MDVAQKKQDDAMLCLIALWIGGAEVSKRA